MEVPQEFKDIQDKAKDSKVSVETVTSNLEYFRVANSRFDMFAVEFSSIDWKLREIATSLNACIAELYDLENKIAVKEILNPGVYESFYGNAISWDGQVAYDLDMGENVEFGVILKDKYIRPLD